MPQISPTNVLLTTVYIQTIIIYLPNIVNNMKLNTPNNYNTIINTENPLNW